MSTILPCSYFYSEISCLDQNIESLLSQIPHKERVVSLIFFGPTEDTLYEKELSIISSLVAANFGSVFPLVSYIAQSLMDPQKMAVEVHYIPTADGFDSLFFKHYSNVRYAVFNWENAKILMIEGARANSFSDSYKIQGDEIFQKIEAILCSESICIHEIVRQWNYIGKITEIWNGVQNYQSFNDTRARFYEKTNWGKIGYPAATGIGINISCLIVSLIAVSCQSGIKTFPVNNPLQTPAHKYSASVVAGGKDSAKNNPKFERAKFIQTRFGSFCFISGTAAILGEESIGDLDASTQTRQTIENINCLISPENLMYQVLDKESHLIIMALRVYIKKKEYFDTVKAEIDKVWSKIPAIYLQADICRSELLVEIEGIAMEIF